jgi:hypothetical protein
MHWKFAEAIHANSQISAGRACYINRAGSGHLQFLKPVSEILSQQQKFKIRDSD